MNADQLIQYVSWLTYILIFANAVVQAVRRPRRANIDIALFFTSTTIIIALSVLNRLELVQADSIWSRASSILSTSLFVALPYLLLRLVDDFSDVPAWLMRSAEVVLGLIVLVVIAAPDLLRVLLLPLIGYMVGLLFYGTLAFWRESRKSSGVTRRRLVAIALGSIFLGTFLIVLGLVSFLPGLAGLGRALADGLSLASGVSYFMGFAPPRILRRAWQEPELRAFLGRAASLPRLPDTNSIMRALEQGVRDSVGAPSSRIGLWNEETQTLHFSMDSEELELQPNMESIAGRAFLQQSPAFTDDVNRDTPGVAPQAQTYGAKAILAAPITAGNRKLGVLTAYAPRAPIFADEDLELVKLLADQAAVILESRALIDEAARVRAREEVARLKEDFLSAAAHDLKTPLTVLVAQAQFLERKATRNPEAPTDPGGLRRIVQEAQRLRQLVLELLDASRAEQGMLVGDLEDVDLVEVAQQVCARRGTQRHPCKVDAAGQVPGRYDSVRIVQLVENLVENAIKYSPEGGPVQVRVWRDGERNYLSVRDRGIGIPSADIPHLFERFHRGANVNDRRFAGMGLGLFICRGIAEQHGGRIWATSEPGKGSTFHVTLPVNPETVIARQGTAAANEQVEGVTAPGSEQSMGGPGQGSRTPGTPLVLAEGGTHGAARPNTGD